MGKKSTMQKIVMGVVMLLVICTAALPFVVGAQGPGAGGGPGAPGNVGSGGGGTGIQNPLGGADTLPAFISLILTRIVRPIGFSIITLMIIYSGFLFVIARGNPSGLEKAKTTFFWTLIGAAVLLGSEVIANIINSTILELGN